MEPVSLISIFIIFFTIALCLVLSITKKFHITMILALAMMALFVIQVLFEPALIQQSVSFFSMMTGGGGRYMSFWLDLGFIPEFFFNDPGYWYTIITAMFTHASIAHLFMNLIILLILGQQLEAKIGSTRFFILFIASGVIGMFFTGILGYFGIFGKTTFFTGIGASGAIYGLLGCFFYMYPNKKITFPLIFIFSRLPVWVFALVHFTIQAALFVFTINNGQGGVSYDGHIGGLIGGIMIGIIYKKFFDIGKPQPKTSQALEKLATTKKLKEVLERIQGEDTPEVRKVWLEEFGKNLKCPECSKKGMTYEKKTFKCENEHEIKIDL